LRLRLGNERYGSWKVAHAVMYRVRDGRRVLVLMPKEAMM
jgi:hypothetical protein